MTRATLAAVIASFVLRAIAAEFTVTNTSMDIKTPGSLPYVINQANTSSPDIPDTIKFSSSLSTIGVTTTLPKLSSSIKVDGLKGRESQGRIELVGPGNLISPLIGFEIDSPDFGVEIANVEMTNFTQPIRVTAFPPASGVKITNNVLHGNFADVIRSTAAGKHQITNNESIPTRGRASS